MRILIIGNNTKSEEEFRTVFGHSHEVVVCTDDQEAQKVGNSMQFDVVFYAQASVGKGSNVVAFPTGTSLTTGLTEQLDSLEERLVNEAMNKTGGNQVQAAKLLKVTRGALQYKLKKYTKPKAAAA